LRDNPPIPKKASTAAGCRDAPSALRRRRASACDECIQATASMKWQHERAFYRIEYPTRERPQFETDSEVLDVIDACESGIRVQLRMVRPQKGDPINGTIRFRRGAEVTVEGHVVRVMDAQAAIELKPPGIPLRIIFDEQKFLLRHYPQQIRRPSQSA
jgi:hypothetical protein